MLSTDSIRYRRAKGKSYPTFNSRHHANDDNETLRKQLADIAEEKMKNMKREKLMTDITDMDIENFLSVSDSEGRKRIRALRKTGKFYTNNKPGFYQSLILRYVNNEIVVVTLRGTRSKTSPMKATYAKYFEDQVIVRTENGLACHFSKPKERISIKSRLGKRSRDDDVTSQTKRGRY